MGDAIVDAARRVQPAVRERADDIERQRRLTPDVVSLLRDAGLFRLCVPRAYGGPEADPMTLVRAVEAVATADGATGWCVAIASTTSSLASFLPPATAQAIYGDANVVTGGAYAPTGRGEAVSGGYRITGQWSWGSGTDHCDWITGGVTMADGSFHLAWFPAADVELLDTWYSVGLNGTASCDYRVHDVFVPESHTIRPGYVRSQVDSPVAAFPNYNLLACGIAAVTLGLGRRAIDELVALAAGKRPAFSSRTLAQSGTAQGDIARAEAKVGAARAFLLDELSQAWACAVDARPVDLAMRARIRLACTHAARSSAEAVDLAFNLGGGSSVLSSNPLQRCFRDVHTATQHLMVSPRIDETVGKVLFGLEVDASAL